MTEYRTFLDTKRRLATALGPVIEADDVHSLLFPFQRALVVWAVRKGQLELWVA